MPPPGLITRATAPSSGWRYSVIRKAVMAVSGVVLVAFLFGHWHGNLVLLEGEAAFNAYLVWLGEHPVLHYGIWLVLITAFSVHLAAGPRHWLLNRRARPVSYRRQRYQAATWASRSMMLSGSVLLLFLGVHVLQVRGWPPFDAGGVYRNMQAGFASTAVVVIYLLGQLALALHLYHGLWSQFQTLGLSHPRYDRWRRPFAIGVGLVIAVLNIALVLMNVPVVRGLWEGIT
jgi:succinate dehydrogenase / fumarate reductase cytochrome b subunit